ncbi:Bax inhibitor-1/YccA family membrane protein [Nocardioides iriomotensis]|uniref:Bax inhibitor-1/YccA family protein n=1 Tax=Nocardioides iriomotensis TaxID=715784 RepID=A0A4Q5J5H6_9ACTN|nr:Bax inhibitor-1/YccA family protein [Nocardioides iriomotensis]RYU13887.1 Bax inhibitor-1/YccA family protein [Nocardioides iriomotensis]
MRSSNPVFARSEGFNGRGSSSGMSYPGYDAPPAPAYGQGAGYDAPQQTQAPVSTGPMTIDSVVQKTGITLGTTIVIAAATWILTGPITAESIPTLYALSMFGALVGFGLAMVNSFKKVVSPGLVLAYAAVEGVFVGAFSKAMEANFGGGLVMGAVVGTFAAVAGTLAAYKFFNIQVSDKFRKWTVAALFGFVAVSLFDFVLSFFGASFGFNGFGTIGFIASLIGLGLGVLMLILDFDFVERGIAARLPERESWRAAFGLTVTIIWIYIEMLRILAILRGND